MYSLLLLLHDCLLVAKQPQDRDVSFASIGLSENSSSGIRRVVCQHARCSSCHSNAERLSALLVRLLLLGWLRSGSSRMNPSLPSRWSERYKSTGSESHVPVLRVMPVQPTPYADLYFASCHPAPCGMPNFVVHCV